MARRIGILGGTFDPVHLGHLLIAEWTWDELALDTVIFIPNRIPPHKPGAATAAADHRVCMLRLAIASNPHFELSTIEVERDGPSYTVDTLRALHAEPAGAGAEFFLIVGADNLASFHQWHEAAAILRLCTLVAYPRRGVVTEGLPGIPGLPATILKAPVIELASTEIRRRLAAGLSVRYMVPEAVRDYVERCGVYKSN